MNTPSPNFPLTCPIPLEDYPHVLLAHGGGGRLMHQLIEKMFAKAFENPLLQTQTDAALLPSLSEITQNLSKEISYERLAFTTDSYVVQPYFFPGGDIGSLAVFGTVNDLAMVGAKPLYLSVGFILEEGLPMADLWRVALSMQEAARRAQVQIVTGDTKVVQKGKADGLFINTTGVGVVVNEKSLSPRKIQSGDAILINGDLGRHGVAIMAAREGLEFETTLESDVAPLNLLVEKLIQEKIPLHCLRDLTRGGLATVLVELAESSGLELTIRENQIPMNSQVQGACEILGLDPLYVANEGRMVLIIPQEAKEAALKILRSDPLGPQAALIGEVSSTGKPRVNLISSLGVARVLDRLSGEQLPRIC